MKNIEDMHREGLTPADVWPTGKVAVTFTDGETIIYHNVRILAVRGYTDPIQSDGTNLTFEAGDVVFHLLGVRQYVAEIDL